MAKLSQWQKPQYQRAHMWHNMLNGYTNEYSPSGQTVSVHGIFKLSRYANADIGRVILVAWGVGAGVQRLSVGVRSSDNSDVASRNRLAIASLNTSGTTIMRVMSKNEVTDDRYHSFQISWDASTASLIFMVDMEPADETGWANRIAPTIGTMGTTANSLFYVGMSAVDNTPAHWSGEIGFIGHRSGYYVSDWTPFFYPNGQPKRLNMSLWTEWVSAPGLFNPYSDNEANMGGLGAFRRVGNVVPLVEGRALRSTKDGVQNTSGVVLAYANPRVAKAITQEESFPQIMAPGAVLTKVTPTIDANGFAYLAGNYVSPLLVTNLPAKASTIRLYQATFRYENVAITAEHGLVLRFNYQDTSNYWGVFITFSGGNWRMELAQINPSYVARGNFSLSGVNYPAHFTVSVYEAGDNINIFANNYEVDVPANKSAGYVRYTVASRPLKTATGCGVMNNTDPGSTMRFRNMLVMDL